MSLTLLSLQEYIPILVRLVVALLFGALIGMERGSTKHDAGLRTHIIVCLGAASVMITSQIIASRHGGVNDITRLGAQVISGIGFLGAGSIIVSKNRVRGLTTAAGLWTTACLGLVIGSGFLEVAFTILILIMFTTYVLRPLSLKLRVDDLSFDVTASATVTTAKDLAKLFIEKGYEVTVIKTVNDKILLVVHTGALADKNDFLLSTLSTPGVTGIAEH